MTNVADGQGFPRSVGQPAVRALMAAGYTELNQLDSVPAAELRKLHGMGPAAIDRLQKALEARGLSLA